MFPCQSHAVDPQQVQHLYIKFLPHYDPILKLNHYNLKHLSLTEDELDGIKLNSRKSPQIVFYIWKLLRYSYWVTEKLTGGINRSTTCFYFSDQSRAEWCSSIFLNPCDTVWLSGVNGPQQVVLYQRVHSSCASSGSVFGFWRVQCFPGGKQNRYIVPCKLWWLSEIFCNSQCVKV